MLLPAEDDEIILEIRQIRRKLAEWEINDPVGFAAYSKHCAALSTGKLVSLNKKDPDCLPDNYRYADLCGPPRD